jgi:hypothetical protein
MDRKMPRVTEVLREVGITDFSRVPDSIMIPAQEFGTAFHMARHLLDKGTLDEKSLSEGLIPFLDGYKKFKKDFGFAAKVDESERSLVSKKYGFCGTPDVWPIIQGKRTLIDTKTSSGMYEATAIQTAAYQILLEEDGIKIDRRWGLQLKEDGTYAIEKYDKSSDRTVFLSALTVVNWKRENL